MPAPTMVRLDSVSKIVQDLLVVRTLGTIPNVAGTWPVYRANQPDVPDDMIAVFESQGVRQGRHMIGGAYKERAAFQVMVRSNNYDTGDKKAADIAIDLIESLPVIYILTTAVTLNQYRIDSISKASGPIPLGKETTVSKRYLFSINFTMSITAHS